MIKLSTRRRHKELQVSPLSPSGVLCVSTRLLVRVINYLRKHGVDVMGEIKRGVEQRVFYGHHGLFTMISSTRKILVPLWLVRQLDPHSPGFQEGLDVPVSMNRVYKEWGLLGSREHDREAIVSPDGILMVSPWSPGFWFYVEKEGEIIHGSNSELEYGYVDDYSPVFHSKFKKDDVVGETLFWYDHNMGGVIVELRAFNVDSAYIAVRPPNPMGVAFIENVELTNREIKVRSPDNGVVFNIIASREADEKGAYTLEEDGDVTEYTVLNNKSNALSKIGWATGALRFKAVDKAVRLRAFIPLVALESPFTVDFNEVDVNNVRGYWRRIIDRGLVFEAGDKRVESRYWRSIITLQILLDKDRITPGPTIYHHFWIRDSAYMVKALADAGYVREAKNIISLMLKCMREDGLIGAIDCKPEPFEADSQGQLIWTIYQYYNATRDQELLELAYPKLKKTAYYIVKMFDDGIEKGWLHPPSVSAEDLGPSDYYYWDVYWSLAGLWSIADIAWILNEKKDAEEYASLAADYEDIAWRNLGEVSSKAGFFHPTTPSRLFLDSGIGRSLVALWPLRLLPEDTELAKELVYNAWRFTLNGGFLHSVLWRALGSYITMHLADSLLLIGDREKYLKSHEWLIRVSEPLGQWCEAHSPRTLKGTVGDFPHGWASADYIMLARNAIVHEDYSSTKLYLLKGVWEKWAEHIALEARTSRGRILVESAKTETNTIKVKTVLPVYDVVVLYSPINTIIERVEANATYEVEDDHLLIYEPPRKLEVSLRYRRLEQ